MVDESPFEDVVPLDDGFSIPDLKWRELVFTGALRQAGQAWVRDPARPMTPFARPELLPAGARFEVRREGGRVCVRRLPPPMRSPLPLGEGQG